MWKPMLASAILAMTLSACQDITAPEQPAEEAALEVQAAQRGPTKCQAEIVAGIASTWPYAHDDKTQFAPPKGAVAKWLDEIGEAAGITSVRELQEWFCSLE